MTAVFMTEGSPYGDKWFADRSYLFPTMIRSDVAFIESGRNVGDHEFCNIIVMLAYLPGSFQAL